MTGPVLTIDVETATGWVRLDVTTVQAFTILRQLEHALEPERLRLAVLAAADPDPFESIEPAGVGRPSHLSLVAEP